MNQENESCCPTPTTTALRAPQASPIQTHGPRHTPRYDKEAWEVAISLPGVKKEDVSVTLENEILEVSASRRFEHPDTWRPLGEYEPERRWHLRLDVGPEVHGGGISGALENGVLTLRLPLRDEVKPRRIEIH